MGSILHISISPLPVLRPTAAAYPEPRALAESPTGDSDIDENEKVTYRFWTQPLFYIVCLITISQGLAHFLPALYIPTFATDFGASQRDASLLITDFNIICITTQPLYSHLVSAILTHTMP
jgi:hypothetical protein